jgi:hypothetical protein
MRGHFGQKRKAFEPFTMSLCHLTAEFGRRLKR